MTAAGGQPSKCLLKPLRISVFQGNILRPTMTTLHWLKKIVPINKMDLYVESSAFQNPLVPGL